MRRSVTPCDHLDPTVLLLRRVLLAAAAPLLVGLLPACNGDEIPSYSGRPYCMDGKWVPTSNLHLPQDVSYASLRRSEQAGVDIVSESGMPCQGAKDVRGCEAEIDRMSIREVGPGLPFLLTTDGDMVEVFQTVEQKLKLLGSIDTPDEALLFAFSAGYHIGCDSTTVGREGDGYGLVNRAEGCDKDHTDTFIRVASDGTVKEVRSKDYGEGKCAIGRRPPGLIDPRARNAARSRLARYLARSAGLEAASVEAFVILERELSSQGLPRALRDELRRAAEDEVRHARDVSRLSERYGARPEVPELVRTGTRTLAEIAQDNAVEGCVSETHGAFLAYIQAAHARDPETRRVFERIALEETRHAALSWQLAAWLEPQLDPATRRRINESRTQAVRRLGLRAA